jgi:hypothetical protein
MWVPPRPLQTNAQEPTVDPSLQPRGDVFNPWLAGRKAVPCPRTAEVDVVGPPWVSLRTHPGRPTMPTHEGGAPEDWELDPVLEEVLGSEGAEFLQEEQTGWSFTSVPLDGV